MIKVYLKLALLSDEVRKAHKIKSIARLDCISITDNVEKEYKGLKEFVNHKGQLFFYKTPCKDFVNTESKRLAEWSLTGNGLNFSSIYIEDMENPHFGYGYPNAKRNLSNGSPNPLFEFRNDGYLFIINKDYTEIEVLIIPEGRNLIHSHYQKLIDGGYDSMIEQLRVNSKLYFNYEANIQLCL